MNTQTTICYSCEKEYFQFMNEKICENCRPLTTYEISAKDWAEYEIDNQDYTTDELIKKYEKENTLVQRETNYKNTLSQVIKNYYKNNAIIF